ncbi:MAG: toxin-antitoxin system YwqK family antitoxin [Acidimicrobiales bacterium]
MTTQSRQPKGTPVGGQFAGKANPESDVALEPSWPGLTRQVRMFGDGRIESWFDVNDRRQDPPDGSPALRYFRPDGTVEYEEHQQDGRLQDPADGTPAARWFRPDGTVERELHCQDGHIQDPPDGSPAVRWFRSDGTVESELHWQDGF